MSLGSIIVFAMAGLGVLALLIEVTSLWILRRRRLPPATRFPSISIIKPLCGLDDDLEGNLRSHVELDYPGEWEVLLGVRSPEDQAYPIARAFAAAHPERVRVVLQEGEPGHNPKVNQLISLTRAAKGEILSVTDSNIRVPRTFLREIAAVLDQPGVGIATNFFAGVGERRLGAILDNLALTIFVAPNLAASTLVVRLDEVVGKSMAMRRDRLEELGGWHMVKDKLAEDQQIGLAFRKVGLHAAFCETPVQNIQIDRPLSHFWGRHTRWYIMRYRIVFPAVLLEPLLMPMLVSFAGALLSPGSKLAWSLFGCAAATTLVLIQISARLLRGYAFKLRHLLFEPLRELVFLAAWMWGATLQTVTWRGNRLRVLQATRLAAPEVIARAKNIQRLGRG